MNEQLSNALLKRKQANAYRQLTVKKGLVDFCSNDYLGFARSATLRENIHKAISEYPTENIHLHGSTGSRLLTGNYDITEQVEHEVAQFHRAEAGLIFNSGYDANLGLFSSVPQRGDIIIHDELCHASIRDGIRLSLAKAFSFRHNDLSDLEKKLQHAQPGKNIFIAVESVYSMDGDFASLQEIAALGKKYSAHLIVDEAHATGIFGENGEGRTVELGLEKDCFARVHTFGKALGVHGAIILSSKTLRNYLVNFCRPFIYTTALPLYSVIGIRCTYRLLEEQFWRKSEVLRFSGLLQSRLSKIKAGNYIPSESQVQCIIFPGNKKVKHISKELEQKGFDVRPILSPTVPKGKERLRICVHSFNTEEEIKTLSRLLKSMR